jgi:hypothetical protein
MPTCPSIHQSETSRRNGALSAGPVTIDGKARSAANATRHGLRAGPFRLFATEDPATFEALFQALLARHNPADAVERHWVEQLAKALWRQRRADQLEDRILDASTDEPESARLPSLDTLLRYRTRIERDIRYAEIQLEALRRARPQALMGSRGLAPEQLRLMADRIEARREAPAVPAGVERPGTAAVTIRQRTNEPEKPAPTAPPPGLGPQQLRRLAAIMGLDLPMAA